MAKSSSILEWPQPVRSTEALASDFQLGPPRSAALFVLIATLLVALHAPLLRLPYFWDEAGYYIPAARDLLGGSLIPHSTPSNAHPPLVLAWLALAWRIFGEHQLVTRCAMLLLAALALLGFFRLARAVSNTTIAAASTLLTACYPVFFAQSSLAQIDLPAAGLTFWALEAYFRRRSGVMVTWFSLAALAKETAILVPIALFLWEAWSAFRPTQRSSAGKLAVRVSRSAASTPWLLLPIIPLAVWYAFHYSRTGVVFGNPEFFRYNVQATVHPLRIVLALLLRIWQTTGYLGLYVLTIACFIAMKFPPQAAARTEPAVSLPKAVSAPHVTDDASRSRIAVVIQLEFSAISVVYVLVLSIIGGAVLARYMLPIVPLWILICVSTIWRRLRPWKAVLTIVAAAFVASIFVNPPYGFAPEDNLAYRDYIRLHQRAEAFLGAHYPHARVLTAWPASDELSRPYLGYVVSPLQVLKIDDFTAEQLLPAADARSRFEVAFVFSTKYQPPHSFFDRWRLWREWKARYFGYHEDLSPEAAASVLGGSLVYVQRRRGQWVGVIEMEKIEEATASPWQE